jgi:hypothetical protein
LSFSDICSPSSTLLFLYAAQNDKDPDAVVAIELWPRNCFQTCKSRFPRDIVLERFIRMLARSVAEEDPEPMNVARKMLMAYSVLNSFKQIFGNFDSHTS